METGGTCKATPRESRATVLDSGICAVEEVADKLERLREELVGETTPPPDKCCATQQSILALILDNGSDRIDKQCDRIVGEINRLEDILFGDTVIERPALSGSPRPADKDKPEITTKVSSLYTVYERFGAEVEFVHRLRIEITGSTEATESKQMDQPPSTDNPSLEWVLTQLPKGLKLLYDHAVDSISSIREVLI